MLELNSRAVARLGPDILAPEPDFDRMLANLRRGDQAREVGDALLDQRLVAGIGNVWRAEALWAERVSPWRPLRDVSDDELRGVLRAAARADAAFDRRRPNRAAGLPPRRQAVPAVPGTDPLARPGR